MTGTLNGAGSGQGLPPPAAPLAQVYLGFPPTDASVPAIRRFALWSTGTLWGLSVPGADLVVTEMASNAVRAARDLGGAQVVFRACLRAGAVLFQVDDPAPVPECRRSLPDDLMAEHGRGMGLVRAYSLECGFSPAPRWRRGKTAWALLRAQEARRGGPALEAA